MYIVNTVIARAVIRLMPSLPMQRIKSDRHPGQVIVQEKKPTINKSLPIILLRVHYVGGDNKQLCLE